MKEQVYLCTSSHFHPIRDPHAPLCLVWLAEEGNHKNVTSKVYRSHDFVQMLRLAHKMAHEKGLKMTVLATNIEPEVIYHKAQKPLGVCCDCLSDVEHNCSEKWP
ncbi:MAG: hypothetical protein WC699_15990 [Bacteroidales bacterium]|jgi:hypothetical protein